ncbi:MAG: hypothetical protein R3E14_07405 [Erythrobacter sp.]
MTRFLIQVALLLTITACAWRWGGKAEKHVAAIYLAMLVLATGIALINGEWAGYVVVPYYRAAIDLAALMAVVHVALHANCWWVIWVGSAQLLAVSAHLLRMSGVPLPPIAYAVMERWPVWLAIVLVGVGTLQHALNRKDQDETF